MGAKAKDFEYLYSEHAQTLKAIVHLTDENAKKTDSEWGL
jgi:hypothetical protein